MDGRTIAMSVETGGGCAKLAISGSHAESAALAQPSGVGGGFNVIVVVTVDCYVRQGNAPVAVADGTDQFLLANVPYRMAGFTPGNKLSFITEGASGYARYWIEKI